MAIIPLPNRPRASAPGAARVRRYHQSSTAARDAVDATMAALEYAPDLFEILYSPASRLLAELAFGHPPAGMLLAHQH